MVPPPPDISGENRSQHLHDGRSFPGGFAQSAKKPGLAVCESATGFNMSAGGVESEQINEESIILGPLEYLLNFPGKGVRERLISAFNQWLKIPDDKLNVIKKVVGLLHSASLLIDDIQDSSKLRRGLPVAHSIFGVAQTINSANYAYFLAQQELQKLQSSRASEIFTEELLNLHHGQGMELYWRDSLICPTEENGVYHKNKGFGEDLTEGKFSLPIIHSILAAPGNLQLLNILKQKTEDDDVKNYAIRYIESTGSFEYCRQKLSSLTSDARNMVHDLGADVGMGESEEINAILAFLESID
ncbi:geranylgeranyl pyrophosphate synthetase [Myotisia sp. PD_48]|nr:geranylgeranyl pyrophosphate synthetase [Myotisia sp. PD_48]